MNALANKDKNIVVWRFTDGRPGHDTQSKGLAKALSSKTYCDIFDLPCTPAYKLILPLLFKQFPTVVKLPDPDLIIGAGHSNHLSMICASRSRGGKTVVLMKPSLPFCCFNHCFIPTHNNPRSTDNVVTTFGALNAITPVNNLSQDCGLILIGGASKHHSWDNNSIIMQVKSIVEKTAGISWKITDSPRTKKQTQSLLETLSNDRVIYIPGQKTEVGWLTTQLQTAATVWVSEDSISMIFEALTAGAAVGLLSVPVKKNWRATKVIKSLIHKGAVLNYESWAAGTNLSPIDPPINEANRCAEILLQKIM